MVKRVRDQSGYLYMYTEALAELPGMTVVDVDASVAKVPTDADAAVEAAKTAIKRPASKRAAITTNAEG